MINFQEKTIEKAIQVMCFIVDVYQDRGYPPSLREIQKQFGMKSTSVASRYINILEAAEYVWRDERGHLRLKANISYEGPVITKNEISTRLRQIKMEFEMIVHPIIGICRTDDNVYNGTEVKAGIVHRKFDNGDFNKDFEEAWKFAKSVLNRGDIMIRRDPSLDEYIIERGAGYQFGYDWLLRATEYQPTAMVTKHFISDVKQA